MSIARLLTVGLASAALTASAAMADTGTPRANERTDIRPAARPTTTHTPTPADVTAGALARERAYESYGRPAAPDAEASALAQERYYSSYGHPETLPRPRADDAPPLPIALVGMIGLVTLAGLTWLRRIQSRRHLAA